MNNQPQNTNVASPHTMESGFQPPTAPNQGQPYQGQPNQGQPYQGQPYQGQPYQGQPYQGQPYQGQPYQGQPYQGQPYQGQPNQGQPYQGQPYQGQPYQGQPYQGQPYQGQPYQGQPYQGQPYQGQPNQGQPNQGQPYQSQPYQGQPYQGQPQYNTIPPPMPYGVPPKKPKLGVAMGFFIAHNLLFIWAPLSLVVSMWQNRSGTPAVMDIIVTVLYLFRIAGLVVMLVGIVNRRLYFRTWYLVNAIFDNVISLLFSALLVTFFNMGKMGFDILLPLAPADILQPVMIFIWLSIALYEVYVIASRVAWGVFINKSRRIADTFTK